MYVKTPCFADASAFRKSGFMIDKLNIFYRNFYRCS